MKKRVCALLTALCLLFLPCLALASTADEPVQRVFDEADLLSSSTEQSLEEAIDAIRRQFSFDVVVVTVPHTSGQEPKYFAADFYDYGGFGLNATHDGILLLIVSSTRKYFMLNTGVSEQVFDDSTLYGVEDEVVPYLRSNDYNGAASAFVNRVRARLLLLTPGGRANAALPFLGGLGLVSSVITTLIMKVQMRSVRRKSNASQYIRRGSFNLSRSQDIYLYTTTTRTRIETSSGNGGGHIGGSGSGGFTGSSGTHHSGHGGSF